jgi:hypothetical protein
MLTARRAVGQTQQTTRKFHLIIEQNFNAYKEQLSVISVQW